MSFIYHWMAMWKEVRDMGSGYYRQQNEQQKTLTDCNPSALDGELMAKDWTFIGRKNINTICKCSKIDICKEFLKTGDIKVLDKLDLLY